MNDKMRRDAERRARWRQMREDANARRAAYLAWKAERLPGLVALQRRMAAGESAHDILRGVPGVHTTRG